MSGSKPKPKILLSGIPASAGEVTGRARVVSLGVDTHLLEGEILVTRITDATMFADIIENASAIVSDLGGLTSHPAIVARELGIPCVVGTIHGTAIIKTGDLIRVDGTEGFIYEPD